MAVPGETLVAIRADPESPETTRRRSTLVKAPAESVPLHHGASGRNRLDRPRPAPVPEKPEVDVPGLSRIRDLVEALEPRVLPVDRGQTRLLPLANS